MKWEVFKLNDICEVCGGTTPRTNIPEYWNGNITWLSPVDLPEVGTISNVFTSQRKITEQGVKESGLKILPKGSLVFSTRASIGKIGIVQEPLTTNQGFTNLIPSSKINVRYLAYALKKSIPEIEQLGNTTTFKEVSRTAIKNFKIPVPPLHIQEQIADTLDKADALRRKDQELLTKYDELEKTLFYEMFGDPYSVKSKWNKKPIGEVCDVTKLAGYEYTEHIKYKDSGDIIMIRGLNVKKERLKLDNVKYIDTATSSSLLRSKLNKGDVVMTYIGVNIGDVAIIEEDNKYHLAPNVAKITPKNREFLNSYFLLKFLSLTRNSFSRLTTNTAKQALNMGNIRELSIIIPPLDLQIKYEQIYLNCKKNYIKSKLGAKASNDLFSQYLSACF
jgi:type I restriction enzyme S subunit